MNDVLDVAHYIIRYYNLKNQHISKLKLQKLLYFVQVVFIMRLGKENLCFQDEILAYTYGPVVDRILEEYSNKGSENLIFEEDVNIEHNDLVDMVCNKFLNTSAEKLVDITHGQTPWRKAYYTQGYRSVITNESIADYFGVNNV